MSCIIGGKRLIPAPFLTMQKQYDKAEDGTIVGSTHAITLKGKLISFMGSPDSVGSFWTLAGEPPDETISDDKRLKAILRKQDALRRLFATEGLTVEIQPWDGSASIRFNPRLRGPISFTDGLWYNSCEYQIDLEADTVYGLGTSEDTGDVADYKVTKATEDWNIEPADDRARTFRLTHSVSAQGKRHYDETGTLTNPAWKQAEKYVLDRIKLGLDTTRLRASGVLDLNPDVYKAYNYVRTNHVNELGGTFQATETWLVFDPGTQAPAVEEYTVTVRSGTDSGLTKVTLEGNITGLEERHNTNRSLVKSRWENAQAKYTQVEGSFYNRAKVISGVGADPPLNTTPLNKVIGRNEINGVITYNLEYDTRATVLVVGALSESVQISFKNPVDVFAEIPVLGRAAGPILQTIGTVTSRQKSISIEIVVKPGDYRTASPAATIVNVVAALRPVATKVFVKDDNDNWDPYHGRYSRQVSWTYQ